MKYFFTRLKNSPVTLGLLGINFIVWIAVILTSTNKTSFLVLNGALNNEAIANGELWRLISHGFIHESLLHLLANTYFIGALGPLVEDFYGKRSFLIIYLLSIIMGGLFTFGIYGDRYSYGIGASGGGCGLAGAMIGMLIYYRDDEYLLSFAKNIGLGFAIAMVLLVVADISGTSIAHMGHLGGLVCGILMCGFLGIMGRPLKKNTRLLSLGILVVLIIVFSYMGYQTNIGLG